MENKQNGPKNAHQVQKLKALVAEMEIKAEAHLFRKVRFKLFVRFNPGEVREKYSWVDWWLVEDYLKRGMETAFRRKAADSMRIEAIYLKMQECARNAQQIIVYDKKEGEHKYVEDQILISIVKGRVRVDNRPEHEKQLFPISTLI